MAPRRKNKIKKKIKATKVGNMYQVQYYSSIEQASIDVCNGSRNGMKSISKCLTHRQYWTNVYGYRWIYI